jgi:hypothetical protein
MGCNYGGNNKYGREAEHSPPSSAEVKEWVEIYFRSPNTPSWRGAQLKARGQLYLLPLPLLNIRFGAFRPSRSQAFRWEYNIQMDVRYVGC